MGLRVTRRPAARADLLALWDYIAADSETAADRLLDRIDDVLSLLSDNPMAAGARAEIGADLRSFAVGNYVLFYRIETDRLVLTRVLSGYRDLDEIDFD